MQYLKSIAAKYPAIHRLLGPWLAQLSGFDSKEYRVLLSEIEEAEEYQSLQQPLELLNGHLDIASKICQNFDSLIREKQTLSPGLQEANREVLDKLAEIRAIVGLHALGFQSIKFIGSPDLRASHRGSDFLMEVARLSASQAKRPDEWWDEQPGGPASDIFIGVSWGGGKAKDAIANAIHSKINKKNRQLKKSPYGTSKLTIIWISLGRDYLTAGKYERPGVGLQSRMSNPRIALQEAVDQIRQTGGYSELSHVILSLGRDKDDLIYPPLAGASSRR